MSTAKKHIFIFTPKKRNQIKLIMRYLEIPGTTGQSVIVLRHLAFNYNSFVCLFHTSYHYESKVALNIPTLWTTACFMSEVDFYYLVVIINHHKNCNTGKHKHYGHTGTIK